MLWQCCLVMPIKIIWEKKRIDVVFVFPSICVDQIVAVFCCSVQRADRERLPYGKTGRRERERESTTRWRGERREMTGGCKEREQGGGSRGERRKREEPRERIRAARAWGGQKRWRLEKECRPVWWWAGGGMKGEKQGERWVAELTTWKQRRWQWGVFTAQWCVMIRLQPPTHTHCYLSLRRTSQWLSFAHGDLT